MIELKRYLIKEHVGWFKSREAYDIINPETGKTVGIARETTPGWVFGAKSIMGRKKLPMRITVSETESGPALFEIRRGFTLMREKVGVYVEGKQVGSFKRKMLSLGGGFHVLDATGTKVADVSGNWSGGTYRFLDREGNEIGVVTRKWAGVGKELFTAADNYMISISDAGASQASANMLLLAAGLAVDIIYKV